MMDAIRWIGAHSNKVRAAVWSTLLLLVALGVTHLTESQLGAVGLVISNVLDLFVETNTESKVRMGERIEEEKAKVEIKAEQKADARVAAMVTGTGSGTFRTPTL
jgi:hypothetical protein